MIFKSHGFCAYDDNRGPLLLSRTQKKKKKQPSKKQHTFEHLEQKSHPEARKNKALQATLGGKLNK